MTRDWWSSAREPFVLVASELVLTEAAAGDKDAAHARLRALDLVKRIDTPEDAATLTRNLLDLGAFPRKAAADEAHVGIAAASQIDYLLTWNLRHIANTAVKSRIERTCRAAGYEPTLICTPAKLMEEYGHGDKAD